MGINYNSLQSTATRLLKDNGQVVQFAYKTGEIIDPATGQVTTPATNNTIDSFAVVRRYDNEEVNGSTVLASDLLLIINNIATEPDVAWTVTVDSKIWRVMSVRTLSPAGTNIVYYVQIRI